MFKTLRGDHYLFKDDTGGSGCYMVVVPNYHCYHRLWIGRNVASLSDSLKLYNGTWTCLLFPGKIVFWLWRTCIDDQDDTNINFVVLNPLVVAGSRTIEEKDGKASSGSDLLPQTARGRHRQTLRKVRWKMRHLRLVSYIKAYDGNADNYCRNM